jgi:hypothetical protein
MGSPRRETDTFARGVGEDHPQFVTAVARAFAVLRCFEHGQQFLGNQDIARRSGLPKPTVSRFTFTLSALGYLNYSVEREKYCLGAAVISLGHAFLRNNDVIAIARPLMHELAEHTGAAVMLGAADGRRMVLLAICQGDAMFQLKARCRRTRTSRHHRPRPRRPRRTLARRLQCPRAGTAAGLPTRRLAAHPCRHPARTTGLRELRLLFLARRLEPGAVCRWRAHGVGRSQPSARTQCQRARCGDDAREIADGFWAAPGGVAQSRAGGDGGEVLIFCFLPMLG